ncbi:hypothetical protein CPB83DRAFT_87219 [Crepidotus variabilis]|uniref:Uncharacterized protein n=1 Tax=Crepidotus variabilis TaxID=179855 RepID=A0A9P6JTH3_9AGAR|nr:hypothetical protein CPB83DRAFT_87219 [Crepidotus variabilis]
MYILAILLESDKHVILSVLSSLASVGCLSNACFAVVGTNRSTMCMVTRCRGCLLSRPLRRTLVKFHNYSGTSTKPRRRYGFDINQAQLIQRARVTLHNSEKSDSAAFNSWTLD